MEILRAAGQQSAADVEAGDEEDKSGDDLTRRAEALLDRIRQDAGTGLRFGQKPRHTTADRTDIGGCEIYKSQHDTGDDTGLHRFAGDGQTVMHAEILDIGGDDETEVERCQDIHRLIAGHEAGQHRAFLIADGRGLCDIGRQLRKYAHEGDDDQYDQNRRHDSAQDILQLIRVQCHEGRTGEEYHGVENTCHQQDRSALRRQELCDRHLEGSTAGTRDRDEGADHQADEDRKH